MNTDHTITIYHLHLVGWQADVGFGCIVALLMAIGFVLGRVSK